ncbi:hypothetical protein Ae168Ps1_1467c [Pseudonocardia sp. Ae168_Ps1]|nr:hypothetical protein Ae150APs1_1463c [Pseudonocardia sp. Ae150A_Ps1]OLL79061.1 hypothetical protein Ae168Ps1_1467c [Pseudonocardia sp. Ae168_Ps1]OLL86801.1 hypothetical protein Ae263Ps1_3856 [Pseudonocardia sp. Ae263_Ps1]OLL93155.1 hypothetical protein Ae356Ps1_3052c [Pseudonocardia sp. Ae356_Ps1]
MNDHPDEDTDPVLVRTGTGNRSTVDDMSGSGSLVLRTVAWCVGVVLVGAAVLTAVVVGAGMLVGPAQAEAGKEIDGAVTAAQDFARLAATDPAAALASCTPARDTDADALAGALPDGARMAAQRYAVPGGDVEFLAARVSGADVGETGGDRAVWAYGRQGFAAVTDDARALSPDLPGPQLYGTTAESPGAVRAASCVDAAVRVAGPGGG